MNVFDNVFIFLIICLSNSNRRSESSLDYALSLTAGQPMRCHLSQVVAQLLYPTSYRNREAAREQSAPVVFLLYPTSNRNLPRCILSNISVVFLLYPTSNRNRRWLPYRERFVVFLLYPTSNRNSTFVYTERRVLYFSFILHQTATHRAGLPNAQRCISPLSYIKPQLSLRTPSVFVCCISPLSYIKPQPVLCNFFKTLLYFSFILHQTAT